MFCHLNTFLVLSILYIAWQILKASLLTETKDTLLYKKFQAICSFYNLHLCVFNWPILHSSLSSKTWNSWLSKWKHLQLLIFFPNWFEKTTAICLPNHRKENVFYTHHFSFNLCSSLSQGEELYTLRAMFNTRKDMLAFISNINLQNHIKFVAHCWVRTSYSFIDKQHL